VCRASRVRVEDSQALISVPCLTPGWTNTAARCRHVRCLSSPRLASYERLRDSRRSRPAASTRSWGWRACRLRRLTGLGRALYTSNGQCDSVLVPAHSLVGAQAAPWTVPHEPPRAPAVDGALAETSRRWPLLLLPLRQQLLVCTSGPPVPSTRDSLTRLASLAHDTRTRSGSPTKIPPGGRQSLLTELLSTFDWSPTGSSMIAAGLRPPAFTVPQWGRRFVPSLLSRTNIRMSDQEKPTHQHVEHAVHDSYAVNETNTPVTVLGTMGQDPDHQNEKIGWRVWVVVALCALAQLQNTYISCVPLLSWAGIFHLLERPPFSQRCARGGRLLHRRRARRLDRRAYLDCPSCAFNALGLPRNSV